MITLPPLKMGIQPSLVCDEENVNPFELGFPFLFKKEGIQPNKVCDEENATAFVLGLPAPFEIEEFLQITVCDVTIVGFFYFLKLVFYCDCLLN